MANDRQPVSYINDQNGTQYHMQSKYNEMLKPQISAYNNEYKFSRGDTTCPSSMHGSKRNIQKGA